jgi:P27 family predicted phage terminase small subunit
MAGTANSGRRRKPDALRALHGSVRRDRGRSAPAYAVEAPARPTSLSAEAAAEWNRIVPILIDQRVLTRVDLACLANYCTLHGLAEQYRQDMAGKGFERTFLKYHVDPSGSEHTEPKEHPVVRALRQTMQQMRGYLTELGFTPAARGKVSPIAAPPTDEARGFGALESKLSGKVVPIRSGPSGLVSRDPVT